jgi:hypothetical protein
MIFERAYQIIEAKLVHALCFLNGCILAPPLGRKTP